VLEGDCAFGLKGDIAAAQFVGPRFFWAYAVAYRETGDQFMRQMVRDIGYGNGFWGIKDNVEKEMNLNTTTDNADVYSLLGFLELYKKTKNEGFLVMARRIADNIVQTKFNKGFFVLSKNHIYSRFGCLEPLALLYVVEAIVHSKSSLPCAWPDSPIFISPYRYKNTASDRWHIYGLTESLEAPWSLQELAHIGDLERIRLLLKSGVPADSWDNNSAITALQRVAISGHKDIAELLISHGAQINKGPNTPLYYAVENGHKDLVELLLAHGADLTVRNNWGTGKIALEIALEKDRKDIAELLIAHGAEAPNLHLAVQIGNLDKVNEFLSQEIDINSKDEQGKTPLIYAVDNSHEGIAELLITHGADVNIKDENGRTPLCSAVLSGDLEIAELLISKGADVNEKLNDFSLLRYALWLENIDMARLLVHSGAPFDVADRDGQTAFRHAVDYGQKELVDLFVSKGADVSNIYKAASVGDIARVKALIEQGVDVNAKDEFGWTSLYWAASMGQKEVAEFLLNAGAWPDVQAEDGRTPLYQASGVDAADLIELLIFRGANVNVKDESGDTPLHCAAWHGSSAAAELLISHGAEINIIGNVGWTPLHSASYRGHKDFVELLLSHGADIAVEDNRDRTPLQLAKERGSKEIVELLRKHGAKE
jgi:serine/threonine-protein phosphatase 6 regulatory ankyrin repeat subunit B